MTDDGPIQFVKPENPPDLSSLVRPGVGIVFSGRSRDTQITLSDPPVPVVRSSSDATGRILSLLSSTFARMSILVRSCIVDARARQEEFRERNKLPKSAKIPYQPAPVSDVAQAVMRQCVSTIESLFGETPAVYALEKFDHATFTGDMRAFKIRLLFLKVRDSLKGSAMYKDFVERLEDAISESESMAGCKPDNSPRRLSKAEQERKRRIQERLEAKKRMQPELPLEWPSEEKEKEVQDIEHGEKTDSACEQDKLEGTDSCEQVTNNLCHGDSDEDAKAPSFNILKKVSLGEVSQCDDETKKTESKEDSNKPKDIYCKNDGVYGKLTVKKLPQNEAPIRKARDYETVEQILEDIESGAIVRYESTEEIKEDLKAGRLTAVEALMFTAALDRYCESDMAGAVDGDEENLDVEFDDECDPDDEDDCGDDDGDVDDEDDDFEEERRPRRRSGTSFSYNPRGFSGIGGRCSDSGDWDVDDAW
jgi:hypothetical protein